MRWLLIGLVFVTMAARPQSPLVFLEDVHDFGEVPENGGPVTEEFVYTNVSGQPVSVVSVEASCGCTVTSWSKEPVPAGETGFITARFEPKGSPGYFNKSLTVVTDYEKEPVVLQIRGQVVRGKGIYPGEFRQSNGAWRLRASAFNMGKVYRGRMPATKEFPFYNAGSKVIHFLHKIDAPFYIKVDVLPEAVSPGAVGKIRLTYSGQLKDAYGYHEDNVTIHTDDELIPLKSFTVYATLEDDFSGLTPEDLARAPKIDMTKNIDFGRISQGNAHLREIAITNTGSSTLELRYVEPNCTCLDAVLSRLRVFPGDSARLTITFNPGDRSGTQQKYITIYSNDPLHAVLPMRLTAYVQKQ